MLPGHSYAGKHVQPGGMLIGPSPSLLPSFLCVCLNMTYFYSVKKQYLMTKNQFSVCKICENT